MRWLKNFCCSTSAALKWRNRRLIIITVSGILCQNCSRIIHWVRRCFKVTKFGRANVFPITALCLTLFPKQNRCFVTLPKLVGLDRVVIFKFIDDDPEKYNVEHLFAHMLNYSEIRLYYECCHKDIVIFDLSGAKVGHLARTPISLIHKIQVVVEVSTQQMQHSNLQSFFFAKRKSFPPKSVRCTSSSVSTCSWPPWEEHSNRNSANG